MPAVIYDAMVLVHELAYVETIQRPMLGPNIMTKQNHGLKDTILHLLVLHRMKLIKRMPSIWLIQDVAY